MFRRSFSALISLVFCSLLPGCQQNGMAPHTLPAAETEAKPPQVASRPFTRDGLYALLAGELAAQRGQPEITLRAYRDEAVATRDAGVTRRAVRIAQYLGADAELLDSARVWSELEPGNPEPQTLVAAQLVKLGKLDEAFDQSLALLANGSRPYFQAIALQSAQQGRDVQMRLLDRIREGLSRYPDNSDLLTSEALLLNSLGDHERALQSVEQALARNPDDTATCLLKATLQQETNDLPAAVQTLKYCVKQSPDNPRLRLQYARLLAETNAPEAQKQFRLLLDQKPSDPDLMLALALVSQQAEDYSTAREYFEQLLFMQKYVSTAHLHLGQLAEKEKDIPRAIELYRRVVKAPEALYASAALCRLYFDQDQGSECDAHLRRERQRLSADSASVARLYLIEADILHQHHAANELALLNEALEQFPTDKDLLYARSMVYERANNITAAEKDLRVILSIQADNTNALNALGYMLVNKTSRLQEGYDLVEQALAQEPDNSAIQDSMGWALYRLQRNEEALEYLEKAFENFPNHEVAAHLGEVLWTLGKQRQARKVWKRGLEDDPQSAVLRETLQRFGVSL